MRGFNPIARLCLPLLIGGIACTEGFEDSAVLRSSGDLQARFVGTESTPQFLDVPFPSDAYREAGRVIKVPGLARAFKRNTTLLESQLSKLNGFSRIASAMFPIDDPTSSADDAGERQTVVADIDSLPADENECKSDTSSIFLIDLESGTRIACRGIVTDESDSGGRSLLGVGPARGVVLEEGHRYAAVVTSRVTADKGKKIGASDDFKQAARGEGALGSVYGAAYTKVMGAIGSALAADKAEVVAIAPYTTIKAVDELFAMRDALEAAAAPTLKWDTTSVAPMIPARFTSVTPLPAGFTASLDAWLGVHPGPKLPPTSAAPGTDDTDDGIPVRAHDAIKTVGTAVFDAVNYLGVRPEKYENVDHGTLARDGSGKPIPAPEKPTAKIWVTFAVPTAPMPASGYPVVIMQHGLGGSRASLLGYANRFCAKGWMAVAIDSVTFGARSADPKFQVDLDSEYGGTYVGPDGISDKVIVEPSNPTRKERAGSTDLFGALRNIRAVGDQMRQAGLDTATLVKVLRGAPDLAPLDTGTGAPAINQDKIVYVGDSLGGIEGTIAAAIEPRVKAWVLNVAGGGILTELGAHAPTIHANLALAGGANFNFSSKLYTEGHALVVIGQSLAEAGDPIAYAGRIVTSPTPLAGQPTTKRNVLQIEVLYDEVVSNESNEALARAGGWGVAAPNVGPNSGLADIATGKPYRGGGIVLNDVQATGGVYRDTPSAGVTALMIQVSPGHHGANMVRSSAKRSWAVPFNAGSGRLVLENKLPGFDIPCSHNALQDTMSRFFEEAIAGQVPSIAGLAPPKRDIDGDNTPDATDKAPIDKAAQ